MVKVTVGITLDGCAPGTCTLILMIHDFYLFFLNKETGIRSK